MPPQQDYRVCRIIDVNSLQADYSSLHAFQTADKALTDDNRRKYFKHFDKYFIPKNGNENYF